MRGGAFFGLCAACGRRAQFGALGPDLLEIEGGGAASRTKRAPGNRRMRRARQAWPMAPNQLMAKEAGLRGNNQPKRPVM